MITLTPALSESLGQGEALVGTLAGSFGTGAVLSYAAISPLRRAYGDRWLTAAGLAALSFGLAGAGLAWTVTVAVLGLGLAGVGFCWSVTGATTRIYDRVPQRLRGRVMALWSIAFAGSRPLSAAFSGALADATSVFVAFFGVAIIVATLGIAAHLGAFGVQPLSEHV